MFQKNERVVVNGFKVGLSTPQATEYAHLIDSGWVLTVQRVNAANGLVTVVKTTEGLDDKTYLLWPSELRYATPDEIAKADDPNPLGVKKGDIIRTKKGDIAIVLHVNSKGAKCCWTCFIGRERCEWVTPSAIEVVLGNLDEKGNYALLAAAPRRSIADTDPFSEAALSASSPGEPTWRTLGIGDRIRVKDCAHVSNPWLPGKLATVTRIDGDDSKNRLYITTAEGRSGWVSGEAGDFTIVE